MQQKEQILIDALVAALGKLVNLKDHKGAYGKTPEYLEQQPLAWDDAKMILNTYYENPIQFQSGMNGSKLWEALANGLHFLAEAIKKDDQNPTDRHKAANQAQEYFKKIFKWLDEQSPMQDEKPPTRVGSQDAANIVIAPLNNQQNKDEQSMRGDDNGGLTEDEAIGDLKKQFIRPDPNRQKDIKYSASEIVGNISLAYHRGLAARQMQSDAVEFAEWLENNFAFSYGTYEKIDQETKRVVLPRKEYTTQQLYTIFRYQQSSKDETLK